MQSGGCTQSNDKSKSTLEKCSERKFIIITSLFLPGLRTISICLFFWFVIKCNRVL